VKPKVLVTQRIPEPGVEMLDAECDVEVLKETGIPSKSELLEAIGGKDGLLCLLTDVVDVDVMEAAPTLRVISNYAVGFDNVAVDAATQRGIAVTNTPGVLTETTADLTWALLLAVARRIAEADKWTRAGNYRGWDPLLLLGTDVYGKTLGILGMGRIGRAVARRARGFDMHVIYYDTRRASRDVEESLRLEFLSKDEVITNADYLSVHAPLTPETRHMIGARELRMMKRSAYLINVARGPVVDEKSLVEALSEGMIAGAAFDVYEDEPNLAPGLTELDNVVLAPHIGSATTETRSKMAVMAAQNLLAVLKGEAPEHCANPEVLRRA